MEFLRKHTNCPVPTVFHYDANPYNRLGGEYILMSKVMKPLASLVIWGVISLRTGFCAGKGNSSF